MKYFGQGPRFLGAAVLGIVVSTSPSCVEAVTIDFDSLNGTTIPHLTAITTQYQSEGVLFASDAPHPARIWQDPGEATSDPNILVGNTNFANLFIEFVDSTGSPRPALEADFNLISVGWAVITVSSRSSSGDVIESFEFTHPGGPLNGYGHVDPVSFTECPISSIEMVFTVPVQGDGVGIDDLTFYFDCEPIAVESRSWGAIKRQYR